MISVDIRISLRSFKSSLINPFPDMGECFFLHALQLVDTRKDLDGEQFRMMDWLSPFNLIDYQHHRGTQQPAARSSGMRRRRSPLVR